VAALVPLKEEVSLALQRDGVVRVRTDGAGPVCTMVDVVRTS
jgi:hypothetical protein